MDLSKIYNLMPNKIKKSEKMTIFLMRIYKFIAKNRKSNEKPNQLINFIFKSSNIRATGSLRDCQLVYLELLRFIDNVCNKYGLEYMLAYGTLLGAVRHDGFIPWDDDCDIIMLRNDYNKLIEVLPNEIKRFEFLKEKCGLTRLININDNYFKDFNSIYDEGHGEYFVESGLGKSLFLQFGWIKPLVKLDVFPYDYLKEESINDYSKNYLAYKYHFRGLYYEKNFSFNDEFNKKFNKIGYSNEETEYVAEGIDASYFDDFGVINQNVFFPLKKINFEGYEFKCPNDCHKALEIWYGKTYMDVPSHVWGHNYMDYNSSLFNSKSEMDESFRDTIKYLKEINDNF